MRSWIVFVGPMHSVQITADDLECTHHIITFRRDGRVAAQFSQVVGWCELFGEKPESATVLTLVGNDGVAPPAPPAPTPAA